MQTAADALSLLSFHHVHGVQVSVIRRFVQGGNGEGVVIGIRTAVRYRLPFPSGTRISVDLPTYQRESVGTAFLQPGQSDTVVVPYVIRTARRAVYSAGNSEQILSGIVVSRRRYLHLVVILIIDYTRGVVRISPDGNIPGIHERYGFGVVEDVIDYYREYGLIQRDYFHGEIAAAAGYRGAVHTSVGNREIADGGRGIDPGQRIVLHHAVDHISHKAVAHGVTGIAGDRFFDGHTQRRAVIDDCRLRIAPYRTGRVDPFEAAEECGRNIPVQKLYLPGDVDLFYEFDPYHQTFGDVV